jgi:uncharacterized protein YecT (DUF1311 family)
MVRVVLALIALLFVVPVAQAASFDCSKAGTSFEKAICASPDLSHQDEVLAQAYATALGGLSAPSATSLKTTQHDWLDYAAKACSDDAQPIAGAYNDDQTNCLISTFKSRISALEASRMLGGYRFYPDERYLIEQDTDADTNSYNRVATKHHLTVKIDGTDEVATAFNAMTDKMRAGYTDLFEDGELKAGDTTDDADITTTVKAVTDYRITLETDNYTYGHGAAHGNYGVGYDHFLVHEERPLLATDIFTGKSWKKTLGELVVDKVKAQLGDDYFNDSEKDIPDWVADPSRWDFSDEGLVVQFNPYEVAAYAAGAITVTIPWNDLRDMFAANGEAIATY